jgi:hypothetical protein
MKPSQADRSIEREIVQFERRPSIWRSLNQKDKRPQIALTPGVARIFPLHQVMVPNGRYF